MKWLLVIVINFYFYTCAKTVKSKTDSPAAELAYFKWFLYRSIRFDWVRKSNSIELSHKFSLVRLRSISELIEPNRSIKFDWVRLSSITELFD